MRRAGLAAAALAALGALQTLAFVHTAALWWLPLAACALLAASVHQSTPRIAAIYGWAYGSGWLAAGVWWLYVSMHRYGGLPAPLAALAVALLALGLSLLLAAAMAAAARWRCGRALSDATLYACAWLAAELARGTLFTGFPWLASGYAQIDGPLAWLAPWVGVYGIGACGAFAAALAAHAWRQRRLSLAPAGALLVTVLVLALPGVRGPVDFTAPVGMLRVALLQTDVAQDEKFALAQMPHTLAWLAAALTDARADLIVAPETAIPLPPADLAALAPGYWQTLQAHFARKDGPAALVGAPLGDTLQGYTNSVVAFAPPPTPPYRYDKSHLVPFGEFIPTGLHWFTAMMSIPLGDFNRGVPDQPSFAWRGERIAPTICYEDLFGEELALRFADPARAPTMLVNVSNIAWFGDTVALPQHLAISRMRSLELQRPMLRATNTGVTAAIDHRGRVTAVLAPYTRGVLDVQAQGRQGLTPYARWAAAAGLWPLALLAAIGIGAAIARERWRARRPAALGR